MRWPCSVALAVAACGSDVDPSCRTSTLTYDTFGAPFMASWCNGCHSAALDPGMRQDAPYGINFDTVTEIRAQWLAIAQTTIDLETMPPEGGPSPDERALLGAWLRCGAP
jgi:uncharacterized membrane protein